MIINNNFLGEHFLLENEVAQYLYYNHARDQPIIDYHNHLPPPEIANNKIFDSISEVWLKGDHYKWRAMRANGIDEKYITGNASDKDKFLKWAETVPFTMRNPLYHWTHLELRRYFNINTLLDSDSANDIYDQTNELLRTEEFSAQGLLKKMKVEVICTTDHPTDSLDNHKKAKEALSEIKMLPTFRPDKFAVLENPDFLIYLRKLERVVSHQIKTYEDLVSALYERIEFFTDLGCKLADHGLSQLYPVRVNYGKLDIILNKARSQEVISKDESAMFQMALLHQLAERYYEKNWAMQFHLGALRNNNGRLMTKIGHDAGCDSIGDFEQAEGLSVFLDRLDSKGKLSKTILYNINPRDNELFATMAGNFNDGTTPGKIQWGSAWWFLDQKDGIEKQINTLSNMGLLSRFIGMLTDSRSFLSFPRHEYFRRILCNVIGKDVIAGELPGDMSWLGNMVEDICYKNAKEYFNL